VQVRIDRASKNLTRVQNVPEAWTAVAHRRGAVGVDAGSLADLVVFILSGICRCVWVRHSYAHLPELPARRALPSLFVELYVRQYGQFFLACSAPGKRSREQWRILPRARACVLNDALRRQRQQQWWQQHNDNDNDDDVTSFIVLGDESEFAREEMFDLSIHTMFRREENRGENTQPMHSKLRTVLRSVIDPLKVFRALSPSNPPPHFPGAILCGTSYLAVDKKLYVGSIVIEKSTMLK